MLTFQMLKLNIINLALIAYIKLMLFKCDVCLFLSNKLQTIQLEFYLMIKHFNQVKIVSMFMQVF